MTAIYSALHLLVDGLCALAMFGSFRNGENGYLYILVYNFCAFALQMPFGILVDLMTEQWRGSHDMSGKPGIGGRLRGQDPAFLTASAGVMCTIIGAFVHPVLLGVGNALFHVGGGVGCIRQDAEKNGKGQRLGVFVAPGALGLYLGTLAAQREMWKGWYGALGAGMVILCGGALYCLKRNKAGKPGGSGRSDETAERNGSEGSRETADKYPEEKARRRRRGMSGIVVCCLLAVILRSYIGMAVVFPWKTGGAAGISAVLAVVFGKAAGGFGAARFGAGRTAAFSLSLAAVCYLFSAVMPAGLAALFLFNMTMPITLFWMVQSMPRMPGLAFGFLTFGLFLGFLPGYFGLLPGTWGNLTGSAGCVVTLLLLVRGMGRGDDERRQ